MNKQVKLARSAKVTFTIVSDQDVLAAGHEQARCLWNFMRYCACSYNRRVQRWREGKICILIEDKNGNVKDRIYHRQSLAGRLPKGAYPGKYGIDKALRNERVLSDRCYTYTISEFDIAMKSWWGNLKSNPKARPPRYCKNPRQLTFELGRNAKHLGDWRFRLTVLGNHTPDRHAIVKMHVRPSIKVCDVKLIRVRSDGTGSIVYYTAPTQATGERIAAIDLGIINIAVVAFQSGESILYSGRGLLASNQWYQKKASRCKPSGWTKGKAESRQSKRNIRYRRKAGNIQKLAIHNVTRSIVDECVERGIGLIIMGDLKHIRKDKDWGKKGNQRLHAWPFAELLRQVTYKAEEVGIEVKAVSERNTSKSCHICGSIGRRVKRGLFKCPDCGVTMNADVNGAFGILNKVSPVPVVAGIGVDGILPTMPSPLAVMARIGEAQKAAVANEPRFVAKFDLRNWSIVQTGCNGNLGDYDGCNHQMLGLEGSVATSNSQMWRL